MSVLIKGMDMPKDCAECDDRMLLMAIDCPYFKKNGRHENCPLVEVPTPHGRLLDEDEILPKHDRKKGIIYCGNLAEITTVIEAEE